MKRTLQNIGKLNAVQTGRRHMQASDIARNVLIDTTSANDPSPLVGQFNAVLVSAASPQPSSRRETPEQRWRRFIAEWEASSHPNPNRMLTVNFDKEALDAHIKTGGTISSFKTRLLDHMRRICRRSGHPWLAAWAIEVRNLPHIHILMWIPEDSDLEAQLWRWLGRRFPLPTLCGTERLSMLPRDNSGSPVHMSIIAETESYSKTGRTGLDGVSDYLAKAIEPNSQRRRGRPIGRIVGRTQDLNINL
jgi:hypothetical protein